MEAESLKLLLRDFKQEQAKVENELNGLLFKPDFSSLASLVEGYESHKEKKRQLLKKLAIYRDVEEFLTKELSKAEAAERAADINKTLQTLRRREKAILKTLAEKDLDPLAEAVTLQELASIKKEVNKHGKA